MVTITVASIEWPKEGKKQGAIIDSTGKRWGVWADKVGTFQQFGTYEITYKTNEFRGTTYYTLDTATLVAGNGVQPPRPTPTVINMPPRSDSADNQRRMDIFVCGAFNNIMANPNTKPQEWTSEGMAGMIKTLKTVWLRTLGPQPDPISSTRNNDMNDDIPF